MMSRYSWIKKGEFSTYACVCMKWLVEEEVFDDAGRLDLTRQPGTNQQNHSWPRGENTKVQL